MDHLGNTRAVVSSESGNQLVSQVKSYYPFGMAHMGGNLGSGNKYLYNGKELQDENLGGVNLDWYAFGARYYDPQIGRWTTSDPLAHKYYSLSFYCFVADNPIKLIDPDGRKIVNTNNYVLSNKTFINQMKAFDLAVAKYAGVDVNSYTIYITGGDRYTKDGKIYSSTNNSEIKNSATKSKHLRSEGAVAVDLATSEISADILKKAAVETGFRYNPSGDYDDGHFHIDLQDSKFKDDYLNDKNVDEDYVPANEDFEHNTSKESKNKFEENGDNYQDHQKSNIAKQDATRMNNPWALISSWLRQNPNIKFSVR